MDGSQSFGNRVKNTIPFSLYNQRNHVTCHLYVPRAGEGVSAALYPSSPTRKTNHPGDLKQREWNTRDWLHSNSSESSGDGEVAWWLATEGRKKCSYGVWVLGLPVHRPMGAWELPEPPPRLLSSTASTSHWLNPARIPLTEKCTPPGISPPMLQGSLPMTY